MDFTAPVVANILSAIGVIASGYGVIVAVRTAKQNRELTKEIHSDQAEINARSMALSESIHKQQEALSQRQLIVPLWSYIDGLNEVDPRPDKIVWPDVYKAINTLELIALCVESNAVDPKLIRRTFREKFVLIYDQVRDCKETTIANKIVSGKSLIRENRAATAFYNDLIKEHTEADSIGK